MLPLNAGEIEEASIVNGNGMNSLIGYPRASATDQGTALHLAKLWAAGCETIREGELSDFNVTEVLS